MKQSHKKIKSTSNSLLKLLLFVCVIVILALFIKIKTFNATPAPSTANTAVGLIGTPYKKGQNINGLSINYPEGWLASIHVFNPSPPNNSAIKAFHVYSTNPNIKSGGRAAWAAFSVYIFPSTPRENIDEWLGDFLDRRNSVGGTTSTSKTDYSIKNLIIGNKQAYFIEQKSENPIYDPIYVVLGKTYVYEIILGYAHEEIIEKYIFPIITFQN